MTARQQIKTYPGVPYPMGVSVTRDGRLNFAAALRTKEECGVLLYLKDRGAPVRLPFHMGKKVGNIYCLQVDGLTGSDFKYNFYAGDEVITDPYAAVIYGNEKWGRRVSPALKGGICAEGFDWGEDRPPMTPLSDSILYLLHVRGFTRHISSGVEHKGTYAGIMEKIPYLKELGITAVELMPSCEFLELEREKRQEPTMEEAKKRYMEDPEAEETPRINYWGYKEGYYFAPKFSYAASDHPAEEFKSLVKALHAAGIELIMQFYFPPSVKQTYILEVIRHWVLEYHVDGFHLLGMKVPVVLLATEPMLGNTKLFCEEMPCGDIYENGETPVYKNLASYNDSFLYPMRGFLKGDENMLPSVLSCLKRNPSQAGVINYITNYSGFSLADLVSYDGKHNEENGEDNRDGSDSNFSWNCGAEGKTRKKAVLRLRRRQMKNAMLLLLTAQGTPMIVSGDEFGFSHRGNNNPYCQDNAVNWLDWRLAEENGDFLAFVKSAVAIRKAHPILHCPEELTMLDYLSCGFPDLSYHGEEAWKLRTDRQSRIAGLMYCGSYAKRNRQEDDESFYIAYNMHWEEHDFALPALPEGRTWMRILDTFEEETAEKETEKDAAVRAAENTSDGLGTGPKDQGESETAEAYGGEGKHTRVPGRSIRILVSRGQALPQKQAGPSGSRSRKADVKEDAKRPGRGKARASRPLAGPEKDRPDEIQKAGPKDSE
ncbi:MAG TPA: hypothetical protein H9761_19825 [Candidatus Eisenbergiella merdavium]|uniref:Glycosyl hydrolase family 13 catalytic domain-containing protein n=1 Tax=Candidatus Eisenbergiella merdavium TaxID=2838551 RepID=A0A9D2NJD8_9FIRM|nr:hypothetical protein [Candidatus Eisenbergiella merdavium]